MRAPRFWGNPPARPGLGARLLAPLAAIWTWETRRRLARSTGARVGVPVICVGNITAGGSGKTPTVIALLMRLGERGIAAQVVTRGHGGSLGGEEPVRVDERRHRADEVGDEPLLLAAFAPVWVGRDRAAAARAAETAGAQAIVMDDGLQNPDLARDLAIVVVDAAFGFGNGRVMPAGPLREPVSDGLSRAGLVLVIGPEEERARFRADWPAVERLPVVEARLEPLATGMDWAGLRTLAFAGIGRPEKFFASLRGAGADVVATRSFDDHEPFAPRLLARLDAEARALGAQLVTTEKDAARLPAAFRSRVLVLPVRLAFDDPAPLDAALAAIGLGRA